MQEEDVVWAVFGPAFPMYLGFISSRIGPSSNPHLPFCGR